MRRTTHTQTGDTRSHTGPEGGGAASGPEPNTLWFCVLSWVRTRWALLVVFWLGWLGMLVGAVLIILQAPRCRDLPPTNWWNEGPLYQIGNIQVFTDAHDLKGESQVQDY